MPEIKRKNKPGKQEQKKKIVNIFLFTFAISIVIFTVIGALVIDNFSNMQQLEDINPEQIDDYRGKIDDRLHFIAMQDSDNQGIAQDVANEERTLKENAKADDEDEFLDDTPKNKFEEYNEKYRKKTKEEIEAEKPQITEEKIDEIPFKKEVQATSPHFLKVVIGNYETKEDAQNELMKIKSQFSSTPIIRVVNHKYALQVASFKTEETAYAFVNSLRQQGFVARIIEE